MLKVLYSGRPAAVLRASLLTAAFAGATAFPVIAQDQSAAPANLILADLVKERGGTARINLSAKLRMLSERIPAMACVYSTHGNDEVSLAALTAALDEFAKIVKGLEAGDDSIGILGAEDSSKALKGLKILAEEWAPMEAAAKDLIASGGDNPAALAKLYEQEPNVLKITQKLAVEIGAIYTDPNSLTIGSAMSIDIAGRQRMLLQMMTKEGCLISTGTGTTDSPARLQATVDMFDKTLAAMIDGLPEAGLPPAPTPEIRAELEALRADWQANRVIIDGVVGGTALDAAGLGGLLVSNDRLMASMNTIVAAYAKASAF
jgi:hypothetical protein